MSMAKIATPITKAISATLNVGKSYPKIIKSKKSTTYPASTLSIKLPIAPDINKITETE